MATQTPARDVRHNFAAGLVHGVFYRAGIAFSEPMSVLPVFLNHFTGSLTMIGMFSALMQGGGVLPQIFVARSLEGRPRKKPVLVAAIWVRAAAWGILGLLTYFGAGSNPMIALVALVVLLFIFSFAGGVASVPFTDIWGKALPATLRGRFFGHRQLWGGLMAVGSAWVVKRVLEDPDLSFPGNYGLLFLLSFLFLVISYVGLSSVREPRGEAVSAPRPLGEFLRGSLGLLKRDRDFALLLGTQLALGFGGMAMPFYALYGKNELALPVGEIGYLVGAQVVGSIASNIAWGELSDRVGNRSVIRLTALLGFLVPVTALASGCVLGPRLLIGVFALIGLAGSGAGIGFTNYLLEIAPPAHRPAYVAIDGTVTGLAFALPVVGGVVVDLWGYRAVFALAAAVMGIGAMLALALRCVRGPLETRESRT